MDWAFLLALIPLLFVADEIRKLVVRTLDARKSSRMGVARTGPEGEAS
jgi:hypothetical protein